MPPRPWLTESDKPTYQVLKWIGGGGFGQVFKVLRNGQVRSFPYHSHPIPTKPPINEI
jgi:hypothetical protein